MDLASHLRTYAATKGFDALDVRSTWAVHSLIVPYLQKSSEQPVHLAIVLNGRMADRVSYHYIYQHTYAYSHSYVCANMSMILTDSQMLTKHGWQPSWKDFKSTRSPYWNLHVAFTPRCLSSGPLIFAVRNSRLRRPGDCENMYSMRVSSPAAYSKPCICGSANCHLPHQHICSLGLHTGLHFSITDTPATYHCHQHP